MGQSRSGRAWKALRITLSLFFSLWSLPCLIFGGYLLWCWIRTHVTDLYYVDYPYFIAGTFCVGLGLLCLAVIVTAAFRRSFFGLLYLVPAVLGFYMMVCIPEVRPHVMRSMVNDSNYISDAGSYLRVWHEEHNAFPANEAEFAKAFAECPAVWHRITTKPQSQYMRRGVAVPYQVVVERNATGPRLDRLSERPGVIYYSVSSDLQSLWVTMTALHEDMAKAATVGKVADDADGKMRMASAHGREYPRDEAALQDYRTRVITDASYRHPLAETLYDLGVVYAQAHRWQEAEASFKESLAIRNQLAKSDPEWYSRDIASTLNRLGDLYSASSRPKEAEDAYKRALEIRRRLAKENAEWHAFGLAQTLNGLGSLYVKTKRLNDAEQAYIESLAICRELMKQNAIAYTPDVAATLNDLGLLYKSQGHHQQAAKACSEATNIFQQLANNDPATYDPVLPTVCGANAPQN